MPLKASPGSADRVAMEAYLSKALWRGGIKLTVGLAVVGALVGVRIVTVTPAAVESDFDQLERLGAELAAEAAGASGDAPDDGRAPATSDGSGRAQDGSVAASRTGAEAADFDRLVRCHGEGGVQFMRAADCATRGGELEELPPPEPEVLEPSAEG